MNGSQLQKGTAGFGSSDTARQLLGRCPKIRKREILAESAVLVGCAGLGVFVCVWIVFYRAWLKLTVLIKSLYMCNPYCSCLLLTKQPFGLQCYFRCKRYCFYELMLRLKSFFFPHSALQLECIEINVPGSKGFISQS